MNRSKVSLQPPRLAPHHILASLVWLTLGGGCTGPIDSPETGEIPDWVTFRDSSEEHLPDGGIFYRVEWDVGFETEAQLREYYLSRYDPAEDPALVGVIEAGLAVNRVGGADDLWPDGEVRSLSYCVSDAFGSTKARAVTEMQQATSHWMSVANVRFIYVPAEDDFCNNANPNVDVPVRPWSNGGACAFFPSGGGCVEGVLVIDYFDFDTNPVCMSIAPNVQTVGVLRHELGHVLGFRHEHTRPEAGPTGTCFEDNDWRGLTAYDSTSVMHYNWCNGGILAQDLSITRLDAAGSISVYGMSPALLVSVM